jgi:hypothetical protein
VALELVNYNNKETLAVGGFVRRWSQRAARSGGSKLVAVSGKSFHERSEPQRMPADV